LSPEADSSVLIVAGEASADAHGAKVLECLLKRLPNLKCFGLGGERLKAAGLEIIADPAALNVVGVSEVFKSLGRIRKVFTTIQAEVAIRKPAVALLIDLPDFNLRLAKKLKRAGVAVVYYIAPQAWAWRKGRVRQIRRRVDKLCVVFPFEEPFFKNHAIEVEYVGHPLCEERVEQTQPDDNKVVLLPGSRAREIQRLLPAIAGAAEILAKSKPDLHFVLPLAANLDRQLVEELLKKTRVKVKLTNASAREVLTGARLAIAASGTVTLEAALAGVPMVVVYRVSRITYAMVRPIYQLKNVCIVNILAGHELVPELLQRRVQAQLIAEQCSTYLQDGSARTKVITGLKAALENMDAGQPSSRVAQILIEFLGKANLGGKQCR
jgi:lipid-A-disaccharide synthase